MKLTNGSLELCFLYDVYLVEIGSLKYVLKMRARAQKDRGEQSTGKDEAENIGLGIVSPNISSTLNDKLRSKIRKTCGFTHESLNILGKLCLKANKLLNLLSNLWFDNTGNVTLTKTRTFTWKPKYGFQIAPNQFQMRLIRHTYPCQHKFLVYCTEHKKFKYLCKLSSSFDCVFDTNIRLYKNRWYCHCNENGEEYCPAYDAMCYYNMNRGEVNCRWFKPRMIEKELMEKAIEWKKKKPMKRISKANIFISRGDKYS
jgi:hypothetical protein